MDKGEKELLKNVIRDLRQRQDRRSAGAKKAAATRADIKKSDDYLERILRNLEEITDEDYSKYADPIGEPYGKDFTMYKREGDYPMTKAKGTGVTPVADDAIESTARKWTTWDDILKHGDEALDVLKGGAAKAGKFAGKYALPITGAAIEAADSPEAGPKSDLTPDSPYREFSRVEPDYGTEESEEQRMSYIPGMEPEEKLPLSGGMLRGRQLAEGAFVDPSDMTPEEANERADRLKEMEMSAAREGYDERDLIPMLSTRYAGAGYTEADREKEAERMVAQADKYGSAEAMRNLAEAGEDTEDLLRDYGQTYMTETQMGDLGMLQSKGKPAQFDEMSDEEKELLKEQAGGASSLAGAAGIPTSKSKDSKDRKLLDLFNKYAEMQAGAKKAGADQDLANALMRAGVQIGSAISGTKADYSGIEAIEKSKRDYEKDMATTLAYLDKARKEGKKLKAEQAIKDPESPLSKAFKDMFGTDLKGYVDAGGNAANALQALLSGQVSLKKENIKAAAKKKEKESLAGLKKIESNDKFMQSVQKDLLKPQQMFNKVQKAYKGAEKAVAEIEAGKKPGPRDVDLLYNFIKTFDPESVVREGEIKLGREAMSLLENVGISIKSIGVGQLMDHSFRKAIVEISKRQYAMAQDEFKSYLEPRFNLGRSRGIEEDRLKRELPGYMQAYGEEATKQSMSQAKFDKYFETNKAAFGGDKDKALQYLKDKGYEVK